jgi:hypothetical protein
MFYRLFFLTLKLVLCQNIALRFGNIQSLSTIKAQQNEVEPYFQDKKILSEIFIDLEDNSRLSDNEISTSIFTTQEKFTKFTQTTLNFSKNYISNVTMSPNTTYNSTISVRSLKNRDIRFFYKSKNESNKFLKANKNENSFFSIYNIVEDKTNYMVIKMNKELLILVASISSIFLIAFIVITFLCKCFPQFPHSNNNKNGYSPCRYH